MTDSDGNGWIDLAAFDLDLNGIRDGLAFDSTGNGLFDIIGIDTNESGFYEAYAVDTDDNGTIDVAYFDNNENGVEDSNEGLYPSSTYLGAPTYDGPANLLITMARISGSATYGSSNMDGDRYYDQYDPDPSRYNW